MDHSSGQVVWTPSRQQIERANVTRLMRRMKTSDAVWLSSCDGGCCGVAGKAVVAGRAGGVELILGAGAYQEPAPALRRTSHVTEEIMLKADPGGDPSA
jgi:hypothetical protein